jgi:hypothetical protein
MLKKVAVKNRSLMIELPIETPRPSKSSGKTWVIASTHGFRRTGVLFKRKHEIYVVVNACYYASPKEQKAKPRK